MAGASCLGVVWIRLASSSSWRTASSIALSSGRDVCKVSATWLRCWRKSWRTASRDLPARIPSKLDFTEWPYWRPTSRACVLPRLSRIWLDVLWRSASNWLTRSDDACASFSFKVLASTVDVGTVDSCFEPLVSSLRIHVQLVLHELVVSDRHPIWVERYQMLLVLH